MRRHVRLGAVLEVEGKSTAGHTSDVTAQGFHLQVSPGQLTRKLPAPGTRVGVGSGSGSGPSGEGEAASDVEESNGRNAGARDGGGQRRGADTGHRRLNYGNFDAKFLKK